MRNVSIESGLLKPGFTLVNAWNVRIINPLQISSTSASATCTTTSVLRARCRSRPWLSARPPSRRLLCRLAPANFATGIIPITKLTNTASPGESEHHKVNTDLSSSVLPILDECPALHEKIGTGSEFFRPQIFTKK